MASDPEMLGQIQQIVERWGVRGPSGLPGEPEEQESRADSLVRCDSDPDRDGQTEVQGWPETLAAEIEAALMEQAPVIDEGRVARRLQSEFMSWRSKHGFEPTPEDWQRLRRMGDDSLSVGVMWPH